MLWLDETCKPCKRSSLITPLRMTKSDPSQLPRLLSTVADKNYPPAESTRQSRYLQKWTQVGSSWNSFSNKLTKVDKTKFSSCYEERKREERVLNAVGHHEIHFLYSFTTNWNSDLQHGISFKDAYTLAPIKTKTHRQSLNKQRANNFQIPKSG